MRRTLILTALGATALSLGLGVGATLANPAHRNPTVTTGDGNNQMHDGTGMTRMMGSNGMHGGMDADDMNGMHAAMHAAMSDDMSADELATCESAHAAMSAGQSTRVMPGSSADHAPHHPGVQP